MDATYATKAIVLKSEPWREFDSRVVFYTKEYGKLDLIARGTKKIGSKMAGHLEPFNLIDLMVINGKSKSYVGGASSIKCFLKLKQDLVKIESAGKVINWIDQNFQTGETDQQAFYLLESFLNLLNQVKSELIYYRLLVSIVILKLMVDLGQSPNLNTCLICQKNILNQGLRFDLIGNGVVCLSCQPQRNQLTMDLSVDCVNKMQMIMNHQFNQVIKTLKINHLIANEINQAVNNLIKSFS
jgi:DNA repair protein RecO (recombination protein O)